MKKIKRTTEKGQSLMELALVLVFILILLAGVVDLGRMMFEYLTMRDAAQEGAGYGAVYPSYCQQIKDRTLENMPSFNIDKDNLVVLIVDGLDEFSCEAAWTADKSLTRPTHGCEGKEIIVRIDHKFEITMPLLSAFTGSTVPMHVEIKDRIVRPACN
ncbi:MAG: TadE/TadG family type IV pilus assembly protein [Bellilinea sp.]